MRISDAFYTAIVFEIGSRIKGLAVGSMQCIEKLTPFLTQSCLTHVSRHNISKGYNEELGELSQCRD